MPEADDAQLTPYGEAGTPLLQVPAGRADNVEARTTGGASHDMEQGMDRSEIWRDLVAQLSSLTFVLVGGLGLFLGTYYTYAERFLGPLNAPMPKNLLAPFYVGSIALFSGGAILGAITWMIVMSRFLPKATMDKWANYGMSGGPLVELNRKLLNRLYHDRVDGS